MRKSVYMPNNNAFNSRRTVGLLDMHTHSIQTNYNNIAIKKYVLHTFQIYLMTEIFESTFTL